MTAPTALARGALAAALLAAAPAAAQTTYTLAFDDLPTVNNTFIPESYGDRAGIVDVSIRSREGWGLSPLVTTRGIYYGPNYNDLSAVAYVALDAKVGEIVLDNLAPGQWLRFLGADVGSWPSASTDVALRVYDFAGTLLFSGTGATVGSTTHASFAPAIAVGSAAGLYVQWARLDASGSPTQAYDTGIDNVRFAVEPAVSSVPEPATVGLLAAGLATLGVAARRRRRA